MPLYEYKCGQCGVVFEKMQRFSDAPLTEHEGCGGAVVRLLSAPALQFKGSGWYITDYSRSGGSGGDKKAESKAGEGSDSKSPTKSTDSSSSSPSTSSTSSSSDK
jgi:putative FmdB family regulatory protein